MADVKLEFLGTVFPRQEKNEQGDLVNRNYYEGDVVTVNSGVAEALLKMESRPGNPLFRKAQEDEKDDAAPAAKKAAPATAPASNDK